MTLSTTRTQPIDLDEFARQMREVFTDASPKSSDERLAELAWAVGRSSHPVGAAGPRGRTAPLAAADPSAHDVAPEVDRSRFPEESKADVASLPKEPDRLDFGLGVRESVKGAVLGCDTRDSKHSPVSSARRSGHSSLNDDERIARVPDAPMATGVRRAFSRKIALIALFVLAAAGIGAAAMMHAGLVDAWGGKGKAVKLDEPVADGVRALAGPATTDHPPTEQDKVADIVAPPTPARPQDAAVTDLVTAAVIAAKQPPAPQQAAENSIFGTPRRVSTITIRPDETTAPGAKAEAAPLPPIRPKTLASRDAMASAPDQKGAPESVGSSSSGSGANAVGPSAFLIQLASVQTKSEAAATLSRLKKQFPIALSGVSISRADAAGDGAIYRVQAGPLSRSAADQVCSQLKASAETCVVTRSAVSR